MDDGYKANSGYLLCTESFSDRSIENLLAALRALDLSCSAHKTTNGLRIYIKAKSKARFIELVKPHMVEHFYYKLYGQTSNPVTAGKMSVLQSEFVF